MPAAPPNTTPSGPSVGAPHSSPLSLIHIYLWGGWLTMGQVLSAPLIVAGIALLIYAARTRHPQACLLYTSI